MEGDDGRELYGGRVLSAGESFMAVRMVSWHPALSRREGAVVSPKSSPEGKDLPSGC